MYLKHVSTPYHVCNSTSCENGTHGVGKWIGMTPTLAKINVDLLKQKGIAKPWVSTQFEGVTFPSMNMVRKFHKTWPIIDVYNWFGL